MMRTVTVEISLSNADADRFEAGQLAVMVTPMEFSEVAEFQHSVNKIADGLSTLRSFLTSLQEVWGKDAIATLKDKAALFALLRGLDLWGNQNSRVRTILGRSVFIGRNHGGRVQ
jgi:hypothetical protein